MGSEKITWTLTTAETFDSYIKESPFKHPFASSRWSELILASFGGVCSYLLGMCKSEVRYLTTCYHNLPWMQPGTFRIGSVGYGGPLPLREDPATAAFFQDSSYITSLLTSLKYELNQTLTSVTTFPHKCWNDSFAGLSTTQIIYLPSTHKEFFEGTVTTNVRTTLRKAKKNHVQVQEVPESDIGQVHKLLNDTQEEVGASYKTSLGFIQNLYRAQDIVKIYGGYHNGMLIAIGVFVFDQTSCFHLFNGWNRKFRALCANQLILQTAAEQSINRELRQFNLGESHYDSLVQAKQRWGARQVPLLRLTPQLSVKADQS